MNPKSKTILIFLILFLCVFLTGFGIQTKPENENNPKISFTEITHDFGKVEQGTVLEYSYTFTNEGSGKLIVTSVQASCGCTGAVLDGKNELGENETGIIKVSFNTQGREGIQSKTVLVKSNDPNQPEIILSFKCEIFINK